MGWISVLKLLQTWQMNWIHEMALQKISTRIPNTSTWITALQMSTQWRIQTLREIAIRKLADQLSPLTKVDLAIECGIEH